LSWLSWLFAFCPYCTTHTTQTFTPASDRPQILPLDRSATGMLPSIPRYIDNQVSEPKV
jgi:hypothetical protein